MKSSVALQIYTGGFGSPAERLNVPSVISKLSRVYQKAHIPCVMIGWNPDAKIREIVDFIKGHGTDVYLWLPVFSGWDGLSPLVGSQGSPVKHDYRAVKGERFDFGCPASPANIRLIKRVFQENYGDAPYDGVFLDKIRFPGFIGGIGSALTCFCPHCRPLHALPGNFGLQNDENPLALTAYDGLRYETSDESVARLFDYKAKAVTASAADLSGHFRALGYKVGLDLFAPFLSWFVGQDYGALAPYADFIKPMFYRRTDAPAGMPFELNAYSSAFGGGRRPAGLRWIHLMKVLRAPAIDVEFINREIAAIRGKIGNTKLYAGIEINSIPKIAPVTEEYIKESITGIKDADGFALSWDLNSTPPENLDAALRYL